jgi:hypothetical protein
MTSLKIKDVLEDAMRAVKLFPDWKLESSPGGAQDVKIWKGSSGEWQFIIFVFGQNFNSPGTYGTGIKSGIILKLTKDIVEEATFQIRSQHEIR